VMVDGGIRLLVQGLLTFKVEGVEKLIHEFGSTEIRRAVQDVTEAELSRVFATVHLEQLVAAGLPKPEDLKAQALAAREGASILGRDDTPPSELDDVRHHICRDIIVGVRPIVAPWGVKIINFQLESTRLADQRYASEYEEASLAIAKAKANQRATIITNEISVTTAKAQATTFRIQAEGKKVATVIDAEASGSIRRIEAQSRNDAAALMQNLFSRKYALAGLHVEFAQLLKATSLTVLGGSDGARVLLSQSSSAPDRQIMGAGSDGSAYSSSSSSAAAAWGRPASSLSS